MCAFRPLMQQSSRIDILSTVAFYGTLAGWRKQRVTKNKERKSTEADIHKENSRLKKEIAELKNANEIQDQFGTFVAELVNEFSIVQIVRLGTSHFKAICLRN